MSMMRMPSKGRVMAGSWPGYGGGWRGTRPRRKGSRLSCHPRPPGAKRVSPLELHGFARVLLLPHRAATHIFNRFQGGRLKGQGMARVTVEDCVVKVPNRFELVLLAAQRAREITSGAPLSLDRDDDKNPVVALREIAETTVALDHLQESLVRGMQKHVEMDEPEEAPELEQTLFGIADPVGPVISENEVDEEAVEEELEEDLLSVEEEDVDLRERPADEELPDEELAADEDEPAAEDESPDEEP